MTDQERIKELEAENEQLREQLAQAEREYWNEKEELNRSHLQETMARYDYDMTGQDGEAEIEAAAQGLIDSRDERLKHEDPWRYSEMKAMGQLR